MRISNFIFTFKKIKLERTGPLFVIKWRCYTTLLKDQRNNVSILFAVRSSAKILLFHYHILCCVIITKVCIEKIFYVLILL